MCLVQLEVRADFCVKRCLCSQIVTKFVTDAHNLLELYNIEFNDGQLDCFSSAFMRRGRQMWESGFYRSSVRPSLR
jgi:hypothetical protein